MHTSVRIWQIVIFTLGIFLISAESVQAKLVTIQISGQITSASGNGLPNTIHVGDIFTGIYTYDTLTPDSDALLNRGRYQYSSPDQFSICLGGYEFKTSEVGYNMQIWNNFTFLDWSYDMYSISSVGVVPLPNISSYIINWSLRDTTKTALSSEALLDIAPILNDWNYNHFQISSGNSFLLDGIVTNAILIPEPASMFLLGLGGLLLRRKK